MWRAFSRSRQASTPRRRCHGLTEETGSWEGTPGDDPKLVLDDPPPRHQQIPWDRLAVAGHTDRQATQAVGIGRRRAHFGAVSVQSEPDSRAGGGSGRVQRATWWWASLVDLSDRREPATGRPSFIAIYLFEAIPVGLSGDPGRRAKTPSLFESAQEPEPVPVAANAPPVVERATGRQLSDEDQEIWAEINAQRQEAEEGSDEDPDDAA